MQCRTQIKDSKTWCHAIVVCHPTYLYLFGSWFICGRVRLALIVLFSIVWWVRESSTGSRTFTRCNTASTIDCYVHRMDGMIMHYYCPTRATRPCLREHSRAAIQIFNNTCLSIYIYRSKRVIRLPLSGPHFPR